MSLEQDAQAWLLLMQVADTEEEDLPTVREGIREFLDTVEG